MRTHWAGQVRRGHVWALFPRQLLCTCLVATGYEDLGLNFPMAGSPPLICAHIGLAKKVGLSLSLSLSLSLFLSHSLNLRIHRLPYIFWYSVSRTCQYVSWTHPHQSTRYVCMYICTCVCMYVSPEPIHIINKVCMHVCMYVHIYVCMYMYVCVYVCTYLCLYVCVCSCVLESLWMHVCMRFSYFDPMHLIWNRVLLQ